MSPTSTSTKYDSPENRVNFVMQSSELHDQLLLAAQATPDTQPEVTLNPLSSDMERALYDQYQTPAEVDEIVSQGRIENGLAIEDYEAMSTTYLAKLLGRAESEKNDWTTYVLGEVLDEKIVKEAENLDNSAVDKLFSRLDKIRSESYEKSQALKTPAETTPQQRDLDENSGVEVPLPTSHDIVPDQVTAEETQRPDYSAMTMHTLAQEMARAQFNNDLVTTEIITDVLEAKIKQYAEAGGDDYKKAEEIAEKLYQKELSALQGIEEPEQKAPSVDEYSWLERTSFRIKKMPMDLIQAMGRNKGKTALGIGVLAAASFSASRLGISLEGHQDAVGQISNTDIGADDVLSTLSNKIQKTQETHDQISSVSGADIEFFDVKPGDGVENIIQDAAKQHGIKPSDVQIHQFYADHEQALRHMPNTYIMSDGQIGISDPGRHFGLTPEMIEDLEKLKDAK